nr:hypothetical protein [Methylorubrum zatmanii]
MVTDPLRGNALGHIRRFPAGRERLRTTRHRGSRGQADRASIQMHHRRRHLCDAIRRLLRAGRPATDPLIYRFYELVMVYGTTWKELIQEEFGDGIMSAIDFNMTMEREPNNKGDRVKMNLSGKCLPYKYYGNEDGVPEYGFKEP